MARGSKGGQGSWGHTNVWNEVVTTDPNDPDSKGTDLYFNGYGAGGIMTMHLQNSGPMDVTANSESGRGLWGGPAPGEPNPAKTGD